MIINITKEQAGEIAEMLNEIEDIPDSTLHFFDQFLVDSEDGTWTVNPGLSWDFDLRREVKGISILADETNQHCDDCNHPELATMEDICDRILAAIPKED